MTGLQIGRGWNAPEVRDTCAMSLGSLAAAREALAAGEPEKLLGLAECAWLDVKGGVYDLGSTHGAEELLKDVAAFANAREGGLVLVGFATRPEDGEEIIDRLRPVPRDRVDLDRYRKILDGIVPVPMDVGVNWADCGEAKGIVIIDVPAQPAACRPFLVPGPARTGKGSYPAGALPIRDGDRTRWLSVSDMQRLLAAGWSQNGGHGEEVLRDLVTQAVAAARPEVQPGEGDPQWERRFREVAGAVRDQIELRAASGLAYREGPGTVQHFDGRPGEAWVLCAVPGYRPVMVAEPLWERVRDAGVRAPGADAFAALGFPVLPGDVPPPERLIPADAPRVELAGGNWGTGFLVRGAPEDGYRWESAPRFTFDAMQEAGAWSGGPVTPQLRIRSTASFPGAAAGWTISPARSEQLAAALARSDFVQAFKHLSGLGQDPLPVRFGPGRAGRSTDRWSFAYTVTTPDNAPVLAAEAAVWVSLGSLAVMAELRVEDDAAWQTMLEASGPDLWPARTQLELDEVQDILATAWGAVTLDLPAALDPDPAIGPYSAPPAVELRLAARQPKDPWDEVDLTSMIDFTQLGSTDRQRLPLMTVTVHGPLRPADADPHERAGEALAFMAQGFGFPNRWPHVRR